MYKKVLDFAGPFMLRRKKAFFLKVDECVNHKYDTNWFSTSAKY